MKFLVLALVAVVCTSLATAQSDVLDETIDKCLGKLDLSVQKPLSQEESNCFIGCLLNEFEMIDSDGKLLDNGIENLVKSLPSEALELIPNLSNDLTARKPELLEAKDACDAGRIALPSLADLFTTEYAEESDKSDDKSLE